MTPAFAIERIDPARARLRGRLGFAEAATALARSGELLDGSGSALELDLAALEGIDSATLAVLLAWSARAARAGGSLRLTRTPADLRALASLCEVEPLLGIAAHAAGT